MIQVEKPDLKIVRMSHSGQQRQMFPFWNFNILSAHQGESNISVKYMNWVCSCTKNTWMHSSRRFESDPRQKGTGWSRTLHRQKAHQITMNAIPNSGPAFALPLQTKTLQIALDNNAERRVSGRVAAFESLPDWRERVNRHMPSARMSLNISMNISSNSSTTQEKMDITVHRAKDGDEAIKIDH